MRILYIDSDRAIAQSVAAYMQAHNIETVWAQNAEDALQKLDAQTPDVIVLELALHGNSGVEFLHECRSYKDWSTVPVVLFCQQDVSAHADALQTFGVSKVLYKPRTSLSQLKKEIARA